MKAALLLVFAAIILPCGALADDVPPEIDYLLTSVGASDCVFIRNGKRHDPADAEDHLRMKYRRGKRYAATTEDFIERLASRSSISKKLYTIDCPGEPLTPSGEWLSKRLDEYRARQGDEDEAG